MTTELLLAAATENPYGLIPALKEGGPIAWMTFAVLVIMSVGTFYITFTKLMQQQKIIKQGNSVRASFWNSGSLKDAAGKLDGVTKVLHADGDDYAHGLAEPVADLIVKLADGYDVLLAPATIAGKNVMPRVAALLDVMQISDVIEVKSSDTFVRPTYAGNALETVKTSDAIKVITTPS